LQGALALGAEPQRTHLIIWGADPEVFLPSEDRSRYRSQWDIPTDAPVILSLGRLVKKKGIEYLVRAFPSVLQYHPNALLVIAGDGPEQTTLQALVKELDMSASVRFVGAIPWDSVPLILQLCDIFTVPSIRDDRGNLDGLPTTILEAMASGRPVVASAIAGIPLAVINQQTGLLVPEADSNGLAQAINMLLANPALAQQYGQKGRKRVEMELNWRNVAQQFLVLYHQSTEMRG
jgi:phosphatidylinositol alpha-1,6-mannosyltransferase